MTCLHQSWWNAREVLAMSCGRPSMQLLLLVCCCLFCGAQSWAADVGGWVIVKRLPPQRQVMINVDGPPDVVNVPPILNAVSFGDEKNGWAVGDEGAVLATQDGGVRWNRVHLAGKPTLQSVHFADALNGWIAGKSENTSDGVGVIFHTEDGGKTWKSWRANIRNSSVDSLCFPDSTHGWALVASTESGREATLFSTSDHGKHWEERSTVHLVSGSNKMSCIGSSRLWILSDRSVFLSQDSGTHWREVTLAEAKANEAFLDITFTSATEGWIVGGMYAGKVFHSSDGGLNWEQIRKLDMPSGVFVFSVYFADDQHGWIDSSRGVMSTVNGGREWQLESTPSSQAIRAFAATRLAVFAVGTDGIVLKRAR